MQSVVPKCNKSAIYQLAIKKNNMGNKAYTYIVIY